MPSVEARSPEEIARDLDVQGVALARRVLDTAMVDTLRRQVAEAYTARDLVVALGDLPVDHPAIRHDSFLLEDFRARLNDTTALDEVTRALTRLLRAHLGPELRVCGTDSRIKRQRLHGTQSHAPLHQDIRFVRSTGTGAIAWLPLDACGSDAPGLEIIPTRVPRTLPIIASPEKAANANYAHIEVDPEALRDACGAAERWRPVFTPGDVCFLDMRTVHRTHATPHMTRPRAAIVLRVAPPDANVG